MRLDLRGSRRREPVARRDGLAAGTIPVGMVRVWAPCPASAERGRSALGGSGPVSGPRTGRECSTGGPFGPCSATRPAEGDRSHRGASEGRPMWRMRGSPCPVGPGLDDDEVEPQRQPRDPAAPSGERCRDRAGRRRRPGPACACDGRPSPPGARSHARRASEPRPPRAPPAVPGRPPRESSSWRPTWTFRARMVQPAARSLEATSVSAASPACCAAVRLGSAGRSSMPPSCRSALNRGSTPDGGAWRASAPTYGRR